MPDDIKWDSPSTGDIKWDNDHKFTKPKGAVAMGARKHLADMQVEKGKAEQAQVVPDWIGQKVAPGVEVATWVSSGPALAAAPELYPLVGTLAGINRELVRVAAGSSDVPKEAADLAKSLKWDAIWGAAGGVGTEIVVPALAGYVKPLLMRNAAKVQAGQDLIEKTYGAAKQGLYDAIDKYAPGAKVNVLDAIQFVEKKLSKIPYSGGSVGSMGTRTAELLKDLRSKVQVGPTGPLAEQDLKQMVHYQGAFQQAAYERNAASVTKDERPILKEAAKMLDLANRTAMRAINPTVETLDEAHKQIGRFLYDTTGAVGLIEDATKRAIGGTIGFKLGGIPGAVGGAVGAHIIDKMIPQVSTLVLDMVMSHPQGAGLMKQAVTELGKGGRANAAALAAKALQGSGVKTKLKDIISDLQQ